MKVTGDHPSHLPPPTSEIHDDSRTMQQKTIRKKRELEVGEVKRGLGSPIDEASIQAA